MVLGKFQWECLAFFFFFLIEWSLNFHKFIFSSSVISSARPQGHVGKHWKGSQVLDRGLDGASLGPDLVGLCLPGDGRMEVRQTHFVGV